MPGPISGGIQPVSRGGTGDTTLTNHGVLLGQGTSPVAVTSPGNAGEVLTSNGASADPSFQATRFASYTTQSISSTLTVASNYEQRLTGSGAVNATLPVVSTLPLGFPFLFINDSTGAWVIKSSGGNDILTLPAGSRAELISIDTTGTDAARWSFAYLPFINRTDATLAVGEQVSNNNSIVAYADLLINSGIFSPTYTDVSGTTSGTPSDAQYLSVIDNLLSAQIRVVTVSGKMAISYTAAVAPTIIAFSLSVPIATSEISEFTLGGAGAALDGRNNLCVPVQILNYGDGTALFKFSADVLLDVDLIISYTYTYRLQIS